MGDPVTGQNPSQGTLLRAAQFLAGVDFRFQIKIHSQTHQNDLIFSGANIFT